jgi:uncharacterized membrane protein
MQMRSVKNSLRKLPDKPLFFSLWLLCAGLCYFWLFELTAWPFWVIALLALPAGAFFLVFCIALS